MSVIITFSIVLACLVASFDCDRIDERNVSLAAFILLIRVDVGFVVFFTTDSSTDPAVFKLI